MISDRSTFCCRCFCTLETGRLSLSVFVAVFDIYDNIYNFSSLFTSKCLPVSGWFCPAEDLSSAISSLIYFHICSGWRIQICSHIVQDCSFACLLGLLVAIFISASSTQVVFACKCVHVWVSLVRLLWWSISREATPNLLCTTVSIRLYGAHTHKSTNTSPSLDSHLSFQTGDSPQAHNGLR